MTNAITILTKWLTANGYDGLYNSWELVGVAIEDIPTQLAFECESVFQLIYWEPAYLVPCTCPNCKDSEEPIKEWSLTL